jgi:hypothetical protein
MGGGTTVSTVALGSAPPWIGSLYSEQAEAARKVTAVQSRSAFSGLPR